MDDYFEVIVLLIERILMIIRKLIGNRVDFCGVITNEIVYTCFPPK